MSEKLTRFPEQSTDTSASEKIIPFSEFNRESAKANVQAAKAEIEKNKDIAEYKEKMDLADRYANRVDRAIKLNASPDTIEMFAEKHRAALHAAEQINNQSINDTSLNKFMKENQCPVFSKAA